MAAVRTLRIYLDGVPIGSVDQTPQGALSFVYDEEYAAQSAATPLSLSLPVASARHGARSSTVCCPTVNRLGNAGPGSTAPNNPFALLTHIGRDTAGAVQILPPDVDPSDASSRDGDIEWVTDDDFSAMVRDLAEHGASWDPGRYGGRWSLAGAQPKMALFRDPDSGRWGI